MKYRITTTSSPSWVAWFQIGAYTNKGTREAEEKAEAKRREQAAARACSRFSPGDAGTVRGPSRLSSDVNYVTRYVNASKGMITIEATSSGQLNMNRGEMRQVNCSEVGSDGRIEIYYK